MPLRRVGLDPIPQLALTRGAAPVSKLSRVLGMNVWLVSGYAQTRAVLSDTTSYSTDIRGLTGMGAHAIGGLGFTDPPEHTRLRRYLTPEFTGRRLTRLLPGIERIVADRLDALGDGGEVVDFVTEFAFPVPFQVICDLLGLPIEDREQFRRLGRERFDVTAGGADTFGAMSRSREFLLEAVGKQRTQPGDGLIGSLIRTSGGDLDDLTLAGLADGVFTGGYETSASMLALGTLALLRRDDALRCLREDEGSTEQVVEELLRYLSVVQIAFPRFARKDLDLFGTKVSAGDVVVCSLSGANRDPAMGENVEAFEPSSPTRPHLAFGHGFHRCVGSELARMELQVAFRALARRFPDLSLAVEPNGLRFRSLSIVYGLDSLPVRTAGRPRP
jgi:cytochrome P450